MGCFTEGSVDGTLNGTASTTLVPAPAANTRRLVKTITIHSNAPAVFTLSLMNGGNGRRMYRVKLKDKETFEFGGEGETIVLDSTSKSIVVSLDVTVGTAWDFTAHFGDQT